MNRQNSRQHGVMLAESAAALALILPLTVTILLVTLEISHAYLIKEALAQGARSAARDLAIAYGKDPTIIKSRAAQDAAVFDNIRINSIINASEQFADPMFQTESQVPTVTVTVSYTSEAYGLPKFPNPDPLNLGAQYQISASNTYRLE